MKIPDLQSLAAHWDGHSKDAKWAVLSDPTKRNDGWNEDEFWATGEADVARALEECAADGLTPRFDRALDFGCGIGRLSKALKTRFREVHGVDISQGMVEQAREKVKKVEFHANARPDLSLFGKEQFDFVLSIITLQHMPPEVMTSYLREFGRVLRPGGVAWLQIPEKPKKPVSIVRARTHARRALFNLPLVKKGWSLLRGALPMEMYGLPRKSVKAVCAVAGLQLVNTVSDDAAGDDWLSNHYVLRKP